MGHVRFKLTLETAGEAYLTATQHRNLGSIGTVPANKRESRCPPRDGTSLQNHIQCVQDL